MIIALQRNLLPLTGRMRDGRWDRGGFLGHELHGRTLGVIGLGRIGLPRRRLAGDLRHAVADIAPTWPLRVRY